jgi:flagellar motility protein MotE (MotC chaperone)
MDSETVADILQSMDKSKAAALSKKMLATTAI